MPTKLNLLDAVSEYRKRLANYLLQYCSKFHNAEDEYEQGLYDAYKHSRAIVEFDSAGLELDLIEMIGITEYDKLKSSLSLAFIRFLNETRLPGKKYLSNMERKDIEEGFRTQDWPKFERFWDKPKVKKFDAWTFRPYDTVLVRDATTRCWKVDLYGPNTNPYIGLITCASGSKPYCIPYNDETEHLVGTNDDCPEYYKWWEENNL